VIIAGLLRIFVEFNILIIHTYDPLSEGSILLILRTPSLNVRIRFCDEIVSDIDTSSFNLIGTLQYVISFVS
jgi:hypothetical protein